MHGDPRNGGQNRLPHHETTLLHTHGMTMTSRIHLQLLRDMPVKRGEQHGRKVGAI